MNVLTNKTIRTSDFFSRYNGFAYYYNKLSEKKVIIKDSNGRPVTDDATGQPAFQREGRYNMSTSSWLKDTDEYEAYTVQEGDTYDSIALAKYNNPTMYWIICDFNRIIDPFVEPKPGDILYLPAKGKNLEFEHY